MLFKVLVAGIVFIIGTESASLPSYITPCSLSDAEFGKCALSTANSFLQHVKQGEKRFGIPSLVEFKLPLAYFNNSKNVFIKITDASWFGLDRLNFVSLKKIPSKNRIEVVITNTPSLKGQFDLDAKIGDVNVVGSGPGTWKIGELDIDVAFEWQPKEKDGVKYADITNVDLNLSIKGASIILDGEPGNKVNELISQNIEAIMKEIIPSGTLLMKGTFNLLTQSLFTTVPYNELFLE